MQEKMKVLIGDDSRELGLTWASLLKNEGLYTVTRKKNGQLLLEAMKKEKPDLIIADVQMPDMTAAEFLMEAQRQIGWLPAVIIVSDCASPKLEREVLDAGADCFLPKPFSPEKLVKKVKTLYRFRAGGLGDRSGQEWDNLEYTVTETIHRIGMPAHIKGYHYVRTAIMLAVGSRELLESMTKLLYPAVAEEYETTPTRVERAIRHAVGIAWERGNPSMLEEMFGKRSKKPTNSEFIALLSDKLRLQYSYGRRL